MRRLSLLGYHLGGDGGEVSYYTDQRRPDGGLVRATASGQWGDCQKIIRLGDSSYSRTVEANPESPAFLSDGSGYFASLTTESSFGCTLWEAKSVDACCHLHNPEGCCDPNDCGPCCENCPTCPTLARQRAGEGGS